MPDCVATGGAYFGIDVAIDGGLMVIGAYNDDNIVNTRIYGTGSV